MLQLVRWKWTLNPFPYREKRIQMLNGKTMTTSRFSIVATKENIRFENSRA
jgi:hypothetical protein